MAKSNAASAAGRAMAIHRHRKAGHNLTSLGKTGTAGKSSERKITNTRKEKTPKEVTVQVPEHDKLSHGHDTKIPTPSLKNSGYHAAGGHSRLTHDGRGVRSGNDAMPSESELSGHAHKKENFI